MTIAQMVKARLDSLQSKGSTSSNKIKIEVVDKASIDGKGSPKSI